VSLNGSAAGLAAAKTGSRSKLDLGACVMSFHLHDSDLTGYVQVEASPGPVVVAASKGVDAGIGK
jgi:hypothetical protein